MRYKDISKRRTVAVDRKDLDLKHIKQNCSNAIEQYYNGNTIFRGIKRRSESILFGDSRTSTRESANTTNFYTLLLDHVLPNWENYPPRSKSWICTSHYYSAVGYGKTYVVLPFDSTRIAVASDYDFWMSFPYLAENTNSIYDMSDLNHEIELIGNLVLQTFTESVDDLYRLINRFDDDQIDEQTKEKIMEITLGKVVFKKYDGNLNEALMELLDPDKNGFKLTTIEDYKNPRDKEVWFSGPAYFIDRETFDEEIFPELY